MFTSILPNAHLWASFLFIFGYKIGWIASWPRTNRQHNRIKIKGFPIFGSKTALSPKRRAFDVYEVLARVANPSSWTAVGSLGAHFDP